jgi:4-diphosphocytidyl-2-C-methyl-D-erythritol kinase
VNLVLEVTGKRPDGYHEIDTVLQTLTLADRVTIRRGESPVTVSGPFAEGAPADETNLAWRAAAALAAILGRSLDGVSIHLEKQVPAAGGLGGGASDAATVLRLLRKQWPEATEAAIEAAAANVGSDEAFFLVGGTARARGRGEHVTPLPPLPEHGVVLFIPGQTIERKTARMFEALGRLPLDDGAIAEAFARERGWTVRSSDVFNAFERVAFDLFPWLAALWERLEHDVGDAVRLAGAGPVLFWIGPIEEAADVAAHAAGAECTVIETRTAGSLWQQ